MSLKSAIAKLNKIQDDRTALENDKDKSINEWKSAVLHLFEDIDDYLQEYVVDGSMKMKRGIKQIDEKDLGRYSIEFIRIDVAGVIVVIAPAARVVVGSIGRVDIYKHRQNNEADRLLMLRQYDEAGDDEWKIQKPRNASLTPWVRDFVELDRSTFEAAIEYLLRK